MAGSHQPLPVPHDIYSHVCVDFVVMPEVRTGGTAFDCFATVVCRLTGHCLVFPYFKAGFTAESFSYLFFARVVCVFGLPISIVSDCDVLFHSDWWESVVALLGIHHHKTEVYRPAGNGMVERTQGKVLSKLRRLLSDNPDHNWVSVLPMAQWAVNSSPGAANFSANEAVFGRRLHHLDGIFGRVNVFRQAGCATAWFEARHQQLEAYKAQLGKVDAAQKHQAEVHRRPDVTFTAGDWVWIQSTVDGVESKVRPKWHGPGQVVAPNYGNRYTIF